MTARAPTTFNQWVDHKQLLPFRKILANEYDQILDDQEFLLLKEDLIVAWYVDKYIPDGNTWYYVAENMFRPMKPTDRCDHDGDSVKTCTFLAVFVPNNDISGSGTYEIRCEANASGDSVTLSDDGSGGSFETWLYDEIDLVTHGAIESIKVSGRITTTGAAAMGLGMFALFANEDS